MAQKISQELDHRSTYVSERGDFLRITQRGMQASNLAGRYSELVTLYVPTASRGFPVLVPDDQPAKTDSQPAKIGSQPPTSAGQSQESVFISLCNFLNQVQPSVQPAKADSLPAKPGKQPPTSAAQPHVSIFFSLCNNVLQSGRQAKTDSQRPKLKLKVKWLSQPLYSRVDAISMSVFVVRQTTKLANTIHDTFRLDNPTNAAFIVGLSRPFTFTLWHNERALPQIMTNDIDSNIKSPGYVYFRMAPAANEPPGMRPEPLQLANFSLDQMFALCEKIRQSPQYKAGKTPALIQLDDDNPNLGKIEIGLADNPNDPQHLNPLPEPTSSQPVKQQETQK